jgi:hypothetical protein
LAGNQHESTKSYKSLRWFKHYNDASDGHSFQQLISEKDYESLFIYWWILEQISKFEDHENRGKISLKFSYFKMKLNQNRQRITKVLEKIGQTFDLEVSINSDETVTLFVRKWSELQENRGGKRDPNIEAKLEQKTTEVRRKRKEERTKSKELDLLSTEPNKSVAVVPQKSNQSVVINLLSKDVELPIIIVKAWADTYPKEYLELELKKARNWLLTNAHKEPKKNYGRFLNNWFNNGWDRYRQTLKSNPTQITVEDLEAILKKDAE